MEPVDLDAKRKAKAPKCEICGSDIHAAAGMCPRVSAIKITEDGERMYFLWPIDDEPLAG